MGLKKNASGRLVLVIDNQIICYMLYDYILYRFWAKLSLCTYCTCLTFDRFFSHRGGYVNLLPMAFLVILPHFAGIGVYLVDFPSSGKSFYGEMN